MHFFTIVIVPKQQYLDACFFNDWTEVEREVERLLAPYDENLEVPSYMDICDCNWSGNPDPQCEECNGAGKVSTDYNPKAEWDWWVIGGRFDGVVQKKRRDDGQGRFNFGDEHHNLGYNIEVIFTIIQNEIIPFAIVTPDGEWHSKEEYSFRPATEDDSISKSWKKEAMDLYEKYKDYVGIGCDMHI